MDAFSAELTFRSSGSTGEPKWSVHALRDLEAEIDVLAQRFAGCRRIVTTVPSHHIYGFLFAILLPFRLGAAVIDVRRNSPASLAGILQPGDLIVGHPDFYAAFVRAVGAIGPAVRGVSSTAPLALDIARTVRSAGIESLTEVYGSSETAGIGWRDDPAAAYELFPYWRRGQSPEELVRRRTDGSEQAVQIPDRLSWEGDRHVRPGGRHDGAVQVGGHNVFPERIREILRQHPAVADAAVRLMRPDEGERLKAFIVPLDQGADFGALRETLFAWIDVRLPAPERPKSLEFGLALPTGLLGKRADWTIVANGR